MQATIRHQGRGESITLPIYEERGTPVFSVDLGKPEQRFYTTGELYERFQDRRSILENYSLASRLIGDTAYDDARLLADLITSRQGANGEQLTLELSGDNLSAYPTTEITVAPAAEQEQALELAYNPGRKNVVDVQLTLTRVDPTIAGSANQDATTPTATGDGPITISNGSTTVELVEDIVVSRTLGRPNSVIRATTNQYPRYTDHRKAAHDAFDIEFQLVDNGPQRVTDLARDIVGMRLGSDPLTLNFNGLFGMGAFAVVPDGSQAFRYQRTAGRKDIENVPTLSLRRVADL